MLKKLKDADIQGKRVIFRVGYDFKLVKTDTGFEVPEDGRIRATIPTIEYLLEQGCSIVLMSYLGRPDPKQPEDKFKIDPVGRRLTKLINREVKKTDDTAGPEATAAAQALKPGELLLVENTRLNVGETEADPELAKKMAALGEFVVYDAFAQAMRVHASVTGLLEEHTDSCCAGFLMEKEMDALTHLMGTPEQPFVVVLGGAKVSDKSGVMQNAVDKADSLIIGGALGNSFLKARGYSVCDSLVESVQVDEAKGLKFDATEVAGELLEKTKGTDKFVLPTDVVFAKKKGEDEFDPETKRIARVGDEKAFCNLGEAILDIGPETIERYIQVINKAKTIFWNGPMGVFEQEAFAVGTEKIARAIAEASAFTVVGGGDTEGVVAKYGLDGKFNHLSTGGGAALNILAGEEFPVMKYLEK